MDRNFLTIIFIVTAISVDARENPFLISGNRNPSSNPAGKLIKGN